MMLIPWLGDNKKTNENILLYDYLTNPQRLNSYSYVLNNPLIYTDPLGQSETAEKMVNFFSGRGWKTDTQLTDLSKIPCTISSSETANNREETISSPENAPIGETLSAAGPKPASYDQRKSISDTLNKISEKIDYIGKGADMQGVGATITVVGAEAVAPLGPEASAAVLLSYPVIETGVRLTSVAADLGSTILDRLSSWFINP